MKKSYIYIIAAFIVIISVVFTSCGKTNVYTDKNNHTHIIVTNEDKQVIQDKFGYIYEEITNKDGNTVTQLVEYPTVSTNKNSSVMENAGLKIDVPKGWKNSELSNVFRLSHTGKCTELGDIPCEIEIKIQKGVAQKDAYEVKKGIVNKFKENSSDITDIKEYTTEISGKNALAISYHIDSDKFSNLYFCVQNGYIVIEINVVVSDECYDNDSIVDLLNSCITFKDLGPDYVPETADSSTTTAE